MSKKVLKMSYNKYAQNALTKTTKVIKFCQKTGILGISGILKNIICLGIL
jgi:hypothetical protein